ncbi:MAG: DUF1292 domain-containing protein [Firmicutes bacterium]|jgi:uncharacterized protein YrzB (UPF0473 family)|nr:DUF1292 domain-containing protein [Bacillota bacterium]
MEEKEDLAILIDEDGVEHRFLVVEIFPVEEIEYAILVPLTFNGEDDEVGEVEGEDAYIFRVREKGDEHYFEEVEDEEEWNLAAEKWEELVLAREQEDEGPDG